MRWLFPNKYTNEGGENPWWETIAFLFFVLFAIFCFFAGIKTKDIYWIVAGIVVVAGLIGFAWIRYQYYQSEKEAFHKTEQEFGLSFDSWHDIFEAHKERESLKLAEVKLANPIYYKKQDISWGKSPAKYNYRFDYSIDARKIENSLQNMANEFLYLFDDMPKVKVLLINEPFNDSNNFVAYGGGGFIYFKYEFYKTAKYHELEKTIKHELTHNWIYWNGIKMDDPHGDEFQDKLSQVLNA